MSKSKTYLEDFHVKSPAFCPEFVELLRQAWEDGHAMARQQSKEEFVIGVLFGVDTPGHMYVARCRETDRPVGVLFAGWDEELHVGEALIVIWAYTLVGYEGALTRAYLELARIAREDGKPLVYTKKLSSTEITTKYLGVPAWVRK